MIGAIAEAKKKASARQISSQGRTRTETCDQGAPRSPPRFQAQRPSPNRSQSRAETKTEVEYAATDIRSLMSPAVRIFAGKTGVSRIVAETREASFGLFAPPDWTASRRLRPGF